MHEVDVGALWSIVKHPEESKKWAIDRCQATTTTTTTGLEVIDRCKVANNGAVRWR